MPNSTFESAGDSVVAHETDIPIRGCVFSLQSVKNTYRDLHQANLNWGQELINNLPRDEGLSDEEWGAHKAFLLDDAFRITTTVYGYDGKHVYGETLDIFDDPDLPQPIKAIYFTNRTAFSRQSNGIKPKNHLSITLDFDKPPIFDSNPLVSQETANMSRVLIEARDITFYNATVRCVEKELISNKTWYGSLHRNFAYDFGLWLLAMPIGVYASGQFMESWFPENSDYAIYRWPLFCYLLGIFLIVYRATIAYAKWAFPTNILSENRDNSLKHRVVLGAALTWLFYEVISTMSEMIKSLVSSTL